MSFSTFSSPLTSPRPCPWPREPRAHLCIRDAILTTRKYLRSDLPIKRSAPAGEAGFLRLLMSSAFLSFLRRVVHVCAGLPPASMKPQHLSLLLLLLFFFSLHLIHPHTQSFSLRPCMPKWTRKPCDYFSRFVHTSLLLHLWSQVQHDRTPCSPLQG